MDDEQLSEFYIACSPPLSAAGVGYVIAEVRKRGDDLHIIEILYEPDVPWFKIIAFAKYSLQATETVAKFLQRVIDHAFPSDLDKPIRSTLTSSWDAVTKTPSLYQAALDDVDCQYPDNISKLRFKAIWRGREGVKSFAALNKLAEKNFLPYPVDETLPENLGCMLTHDLRDTLIYIGTNQSEEDVTNAIAKLDNMVSLATSCANITGHCIVSEYATFSFRWLSHLGLARKTFGKSEALVSAAAIRPVTRVNDDWVSDRTSYPEKAKIMRDLGFSAFKKTSQVSCLSPRLPGIVTGIPSADLLEFQDTAEEPWTIKVASNPDPPILISANASAEPISGVEPRSLLDEAPLPEEQSTRDTPAARAPEVEKRRTVKEHIAVMCSILPICPGFVQVKICYGRLFFHNIKSSQVDIGGGSPHWRRDDLLDKLHESELEIGFCPILTTLGQEADVIVGTHLETIAPEWLLMSKKVTYQVECPNGVEVCIDAENLLSSECRGTSQDVALTYIHCPEHAWGMKISIEQSSKLDPSANARLVDAITRALRSPGPQDLNSAEAFELPEQVKSMKKLHVARYRHSSDDFMDSILSISKVQCFIPRAIRGSQSQKWVASSTQYGEKPGAWYEAFVSSSKLTEALKANVNLVLGYRLSGENERLVQNLWKPAFELMDRLDGVGQFNHALEPINLGPGDPTEENRDDGYAYW